MAERGPRDWSPRGARGHLWTINDLGKKWFPGGIERVLKGLTPEFVDSDGKKLYLVEDITARAQDLNMIELMEEVESYIQGLRDDNDEHEGIRGPIYVSF